MSDVDSNTDTTEQPTELPLQDVSNDNDDTISTPISEEPTHEELKDDVNEEYIAYDETEHQSMQRASSLIAYGDSNRSSNTDADVINQLMNDPNMSHIWMRRFQATVEDLQNQIQQFRKENNNLQMELSEQQMQYETRIENTMFELSNAQIDCQKYRARYQEINEEISELRGSHFEAQQSGEENKVMLLQLKQLNEDYIQLQHELEFKIDQNEILKKRLKTSSENVNSLNLALINLTKSKFKAEKSVMKLESEIEQLHKEYTMANTQLQNNIIRSEAECDFWKSQCETTEAEKLQMQTEITQATLDLIHEQEMSGSFGSGNLDNEDGDHLHLRLMNVNSNDMLSPAVSNRLMSARSDMNYSFSINMDDMMSSAAVRRRKYSSELSADNFQFIKHRLPSQDVGYDDANLLETFTERDMHEHQRSESMDSEYISGRRESSSLSPLIIEKFKQEFRDLLITDMRNILGEEIAKLKVEEVDENKDEIEEQKSSLDEESLKRMMENFEKTLKENLDTLLLKQQKNNKEDTQLVIKETMEQMNDSFDKQNDIKEVLEETVENQMIALQMSLENEISRSVYQSVQSVVQQSINDQFRNDIKSDLNVELESIREQLSIIHDMNVGNENIVVEEQPKEGGILNETFLEKFEEMLETQIAVKMNGKIDNLMHDFRLEVVPELAAIFENLQRSENAGSDDEKIDESRNDLKEEIFHLRSKIAILEDDRVQLENTVKDVAKSKVSSVLRMQNLIDHMRYDNRTLYARIERMKKKRKKERFEAQDTIVNRVSAYFWGSVDPKQASAVVVQTDVEMNNNQNIISM